MKVLIAPAITPWRGGVAAHDARLALAGHGKTEAEAVSALRAAVEVWCRVRQAATGGAFGSPDPSRDRLGKR